MFAELGYFCLICLVGVSGLQVLLSLWGEIRQRPDYLALNPLLSLLQAGLGIFSFITLAYGFLQDDFSLSYVAAHSNSQLPTFFKFAATWGDMKVQCCFGSPHFACGRGFFAFFLVKSTACLLTVP